MCSKLWETALECLIAAHLLTSTFVCIVRVLNWFGFRQHECLLCHWSCNHNQSQWWRARARRMNLRTFKPQFLPVVFYPSIDPSASVPWSPSESPLRTATARLLVRETINRDGEWTREARSMPLAPPPRATPFSHAIQGCWKQTSASCTSPTQNLAHIFLTAMYRV